MPSVPLPVPVPTPAPGDGPGVTPAAQLAALAQLLGPALATSNAPAPELWSDAQVAQAATIASLSHPCTLDDCVGMALRASNIRLTETFVPSRVADGVVDQVEAYLHFYAPGSEHPWFSPYSLRKQIEYATSTRVRVSNAPSSVQSQVSTYPDTVRLGVTPMLMPCNVDVSVRDVELGLQYNSLPLSMGRWWDIALGPSANRNATISGVFVRPGSDAPSSAVQETCEHRENIHHPSILREMRGRFVGNGESDLERSSWKVRCDENRGHWGDDLDMYQPYELGGYLLHFPGDENLEFAASLLNPSLVRQRNAFIASRGYVITLADSLKLYPVAGTRPFQPNWSYAYLHSSSVLRGPAFLKDLVGLPRPRAPGLPADYSADVVVYVAMRYVYQVGPQTQTTSLMWSPFKGPIANADEDLLFNHGDLHLSSLAREMDLNVRKLIGRTLRGEGSEPLLSRSTLKLVSHGASPAHAVCLVGLDKHLISEPLGPACGYAREREFLALPLKETSYFGYGHPTFRQFYNATGFGVVLFVVPSIFYQFHMSQVSIIPVWCLRANAPLARTSLQPDGLIPDPFDKEQLLSQYWFAAPTYSSKVSSDHIAQGLGSYVNSALDHCCIVAARFMAPDDFVGFCATFNQMEQVFISGDTDSSLEPGLNGSLPWVWSRKFDNMVSGSAYRSWALQGSTTASVPPFTTVMEILNTMMESIRTAYVIFGPEPTLESAPHSIPMPALSAFCTARGFRAGVPHHEDLLRRDSKLCVLEKSAALLLLDVVQGELSAAFNERSNHTHYLNGVKSTVEELKTDLLAVTEGLPHLRACWCFVRFLAVRLGVPVEMLL